MSETALFKRRWKNSENIRDGMNEVIQKQRVEIEQLRTAATKFLAWWDALPAGAAYPLTVVERWLHDPVLKELITELRSLTAAERQETK